MARTAVQPLNPKRCLMVGNSSRTRFLYGSAPLVAISNSTAAFQSMAAPIPGGHGALVSFCPGIFCWTTQSVIFRAVVGKDRTVYLDSDNCDRTSFMLELRTFSTSKTHMESYWSHADCILAC